MHRGGFTYTVRSGDSLWNIAQRAYGDATSWWLIRDANISRLSSNKSKLLPGQSLIIPALFARETTTHLEPGTTRTEPNLVEARGLLFVVVDLLPEVGAKNLIRKVAVLPKDFSRAGQFSTYELWKEAWPERFGMKPRQPSGSISMAEHALALHPTKSQFLSMSNKTFGASTIQGRPMLVDIAKAQSRGVKIHSVSEVLLELDKHVLKHPNMRSSIEKLKFAIEHFEGETLVHGEIPRDAVSPVSAAHKAYIDAAEHLAETHRAAPNELARRLQSLENKYARARWAGRVGRGASVLGLIFTAKDIAEATHRSFQENSFKPITAEGIRQAGGWAAGAAGAKIGFAAGASFGIVTGPGAVVTGAVGAIVFGCIGYAGADWLADELSPN